MALVKNTLKQLIIEAQNSASQASSQEDAKNIFAEKLSNAIDSYIKSGDVNTTVTTSVITTGPPTSHTGTGTGTGTGKIT